MTQRPLIVVPGRGGLGFHVDPGQCPDKGVGATLYSELTCCGAFVLASPLRWCGMVMWPFNDGAMKSWPALFRYKHGVALIDFAMSERRGILFYNAAAMSDYRMYLEEYGFKCINTFTGTHGTAVEMLFLDRPTWLKTRDSILGKIKELEKEEQLATV